MLILNGVVHPMDGPVIPRGFVAFEGEKLSKEEKRRRAIELLKLVGIPSPETRLDEYPHQFSGGMKRRLALARALLAPFDALALDEPFTGLDRENRDLALACIRETAGDRPVLLVTHDAADAAGSPVVTL